MNRSRSEPSPVRFFEELYAVVVGIGVALSVEQLIRLERSGFPIAIEHVPVFLGYLNIAFALAHSSVRYLDLAYVDRAAGPFGRGRVLGDLALGVGQFLWLILMSFLVTRPAMFAYVAIALLIGRPTRDGLLMLSSRPRLAFDNKVARIHLVTIAVFLLGLAMAAFAEDQSLWILRGTALIASLVFGLGLYLSAFPFFFGTTEDNTSATGRSSP